MNKTTQTAKNTEAIEKIKTENQDQYRKINTLLEHTNLTLTKLGYTKEGNLTGNGLAQQLAQKNEQLEKIEIKIEKAVKDIHIYKKICWGMILGMIGAIIRMVFI